MTHKKSTMSLSPLAILLVAILLPLPSDVSAASVNLAKTGQATCYSQVGAMIDCMGTGQDGEYQKGIAWPDSRFTNNGDGTITDNLTGLTWLQDTSCIGRINWLDALSSVNVLANETCGLTDGSSAGDWRMPNYLELISLANLGVSNSLNWFASFGFTNLLAIGFWSSTSLTPNTTSAFGYQFRDRFSGAFTKGGTYHTWPVKGMSTGPAKVWKTGQTTCHGYPDGSAIDCVSTGQDGEYQTGEPPPVIRFTDQGNGAVTDNLTGLVWLKNVNCFGPRIWSDALSDANGLADGACGLTDGSSAGDWRLPNAVEIISLNDFSQSQPKLTPGHPFTNVPFLFHWTSSTWVALTSYAYTASISGNGYHLTIPKSNAESSVHWPVRDGVDIDSCNVKTVSGAIEESNAVHEACEILVLGPDFIVADGANMVANSGWEIDFMPEFLVESGATFKANVCGQSLCLSSPTPMPYGCHSCVDQICDIDMTCCTLAFDQDCANMVGTVCGLVCE